MQSILVIITVLIVSVNASAFVNYEDKMNGGQYFAVVTNGDMYDVGWSAVVNKGRVSMERLMNISGTLFVPNVYGAEAAVATCDRLVSQGFKVIIYAAFAYGTGPDTCARKYPNVTFAQYGIQSDLPNLSDIVMSNIEVFFYIGAFLAATSRTGSIGIVYSDPINWPINSMNGFYSGAMYANPNTTVYIIQTNTDLDDDLEAGAADLLINKYGVGGITTVSSGPAVHIKAIENGLLGIGVNGYPLSEVYGQLAGVSFLHDFTKSFAAFVPALYNNTIVKADFSGTFKNGARSLDKPSYFVTDEQLEPMYRGMSNVIAGRNVYLCGDYMAYFGVLNNVTKCLNATALIRYELHPGFIQLGNYTIPLIEIPYPASAALAIAVTAVALILIPLLLIGFVIVYHNSTSIKSGSPFFFCIMLIGCILVYVSAIFWVLEPSTANCNARIWILSIGSTIAMGALLVKNFRILIIHLYPLATRNIGFVNFVLPVVGLICANILVLGIYNAVGSDGVEVLRGVEGLGKYETRHVCASNNHETNSIYSILVFHGLQMIAGLYISFRCYRVVIDDKYKEHTEVATCIILISLIVVLIVVVGAIAKFTIDVTISLVCLAAIIVNTLAMFVIFAPRLINMLLPDAKPSFLRRFMPAPISRASSTLTRSVDSASSSTEVSMKTTTSSKVVSTDV